MTEHAAREGNTELLSQPLTMASLRLPNRVLMTAIKLGWGTPQGEMTERHIGSMCGGQRVV